MRLKLGTIATSLLFSGTVMGEDCSKYIVLDKYSAQSDSFTYERTRDVMCSSQSLDRASASQTTVDAGIPIPVADAILNLKFGASTSSSDWSAWKSQFCSSHYNEVQNQLKDSRLSQTFSDNSSKTVQACLAQEDVYGYFEVLPMGQAFKFRLSVHGREKLRAATVKPANAVSQCDPDDPFSVKLNKTKSGEDISGTKPEFSCAWQSSTPLQVSISLVNHGHRAFLLPAIPKATVPPPTVPVPIVLPYTTQNELKAPFQFPVPTSTHDCVITSKIGDFYPHCPNHRRIDCPGLSFANGAASSGDFDSVYDDNCGTCTYIVTCTQKP